MIWYDMIWYVMKVLFFCLFIFSFSFLLFLLAYLFMPSSFLLVLFLPLSLSLLASFVSLIWNVTFFFSVSYSSHVEGLNLFWHSSHGREPAIICASSLSRWKGLGRNIVGTVLVQYIIVQCSAVQYSRVQ